MAKKVLRTPINENYKRKEVKAAEGRKEYATDRRAVFLKVASKR